MAPKWARVYFGATAGCVLAGVVINAITAADNNGGHFYPAAARAANTFAFFTTWSNLLVGLGTLLLAVRLPLFTLGLAACATVLERRLGRATERSPST